MSDNITINANTPNQAIMRASNVAGVYYPHSRSNLWVNDAPAVNSNAIPMLQVLANGTPVVAGTNASPVVENNSANIATQASNTATQVANVAALTLAVNTSVANVAIQVNNTAVLVANVAAQVSNANIFRVGAANVQYTLINAITANTDVIAANTAKKIKVLSLVLTGNAVVTVVVQSNTTPSGNLSVHYLSAGVPVVLPFNPVGWFRNTNVTESIRLNLSNANQVGGSITWIAE